MSNGKVGVAIGLGYPGDTAVFEFDNFELRAPKPGLASCPNGAPLGTWALIVTKASPGDGTITIDGQIHTVHSGENVIYLSAGETHLVTVGSNTLTFTVPECGSNSLQIP